MKEINKKTRSSKDVTDRTIVQKLKKLSYMENQINTVSELLKHN